MIPKEQTIEILAGQSVQFTLPVLEDGSPVNLDGGDLKFYVSPLAGKPPVLTKTPTSTDNVISENLTTSESISLGVGDYYYSFWVTLLGESTPVAIGPLKIKKSTIGVL